MTKSSLQQQLDQALAEDLADTTLPEVVPAETQRKDPLEEWFSKAAIAEVDAWRVTTFRGEYGPPPTSAEGLELMSIYLKLDREV